MFYVFDAMTSIGWRGFVWSCRARGTKLRRQTIRREENMRSILFGSVCIALAATWPAAADDLTLISVGAVKGSLDKIIADFTKETGHKVKYTAGSPLIVPQKLKAEVFDVVVQSVPAMDDYEKDGGIKAGTRAPVARGGIGVAIRQGATAPDLSSADAFKKALLSANAIAIGDPAMPNGSGILIQRILADAGLADALKTKAKVVGLDPGQEQIAKGEFELGMFNISEIRAFVKYAGPVPAPLQQYTNYDVAVSAKSTAGEPAAALAKMIAGKGSAESWKATGMEPR
jgi:molybdate transport system substrate-binding protein